MCKAYLFHSDLCQMSEELCVCGFLCFFNTPSIGLGMGFFVGSLESLSGRLRTSLLVVRV